MTCESAFDSPTVQSMVKPGIIRLVSERGTGTAFVIDQPDPGKILFATNYHVVSSGQAFTAEFDKGASLSKLEVVKVDAKNDLALLTASSLGGKIDGLRLNASPIRVGQKVAAAGYPGVAGERSSGGFTFEPGDVTSLDQEIEGQRFIQTNANINPGNSGGPVVDACGTVVGVVRATHAETKRVGIVVPVQHLVDLVGEYGSPRRSPETEIKDRVQAFQETIRFARGTEAADIFSRTLLTKIWVSFREDALHSFTSKKAEVNQWLAMNPYLVGGYRINSLDKLPASAQMEVLRKVVDEESWFTIEVAAMVETGKLDEHTAMTAYVGRYAVDSFGESPSFVVSRVDAHEQRADTDVVVSTAHGEAFYRFAWLYEWGDWRIDGFKCLRPLRLCPG